MSVRESGSLGGPSTASSSASASGTGVHVRAGAGAGAGAGAPNAEDKPQLLPLAAEMSREDLIIELEARRRDVVQLKAQVQSLRSNASQLATRAEYDEEMLANKLMKRMAASKAPSPPVPARTRSVKEASKASRLEHQLRQLRREKVDVEHKLEQEQEFIVNKLQRQMRDILEAKADLERRLAAEQQRANATPSTSRQLRAKLTRVMQEKVELENQLEAEQECIVIKLQKRLKQAMEQKSSLQRRLSLDGSDLSGDILAALAELKMSVTLQQRSLVDKIRTNVETLTLKFAESKAELAQTKRVCANHKAALEDLEQRNFVLNQRINVEHEKALERQTEASRMAASLEVDSERQFNQLSRGDSGEDFGRARAASVESMSAATSARMLRSASGTHLAAAAATPHAMSVARSPSPSSTLGLQVGAEGARRMSFQALFDDDFDQLRPSERDLLRGPLSPHTAGRPRVGSASLSPAPMLVVRGSVDAMTRSSPASKSSPSDN